MCFVYHQGINTQFFKGDSVILSLGVIQLCESLFQLFSGSFHLFDGEILCTFPFQRCNLVDYIIDLLLKVRSLPLGGQGNPFKLAVADYDNIVIAGGDASAEAFAVCALKVASLGHQNIGVGIEQQGLGCKLFGQMVGNAD